MPEFPSYRFDPSQVFPETRGLREGQMRSQSSDECPRQAAVLALAAAQCRSGAPPNELSFDGFLAELTMGCDQLGISVDRLLSWTESILLDTSATLSPDEAKAVPTNFKCKSFTLHPYQRETAAWSARRLGTVLALSCGVGKTSVAVAACITAARIGRCSNSRLFIIAPVNAAIPWLPYLPELQETFKEVQVVSVDSLHHYRALETSPGGAVIFDEVHKVKSDKADRAVEAHRIRRCFEWGITLTGTLLHSGPEGILSMLDCACPGLSRFYDKWVFGESFDCIATKFVKAIGKNKAELVIPSEAAKPALAKYLERCVRSLSFVSPEVRSVVNLPGQTMTQVDSWSMPDWVAKEFADNPMPAGALFPMRMWGPEVPWQQLLGAIAVAIMHETRDEITSTASAFTHTNPSSIEDCVKVLQGALDDPFVQVPDRKYLEKLIKNTGLPHLSRAMFEACRMGRFDRIIGLVGGTWKFIYPAGASRTKQAPGPKIQFVMDWLKDNPKEPLVVGAAGKQTVLTMSRLFDEAGISHRMIRGGVSLKDRTNFVNGFAAEEFRVMLLQQVAGSESVDLVRASTSMLVDHDWGPIPYTQYLARTCRQGQKRQCEHYDLTFGLMQSEVLRRLVRGQAFDAQTRAALEKEVVYDRVF